eukprot:CAMPEP_0176284182 /NCGR_PEP_ID=MMETSP0121_2-20121125/51711_1 /TAXON_ID=160619 /ORGANISM="Kryptoperidinium foliaceum, Strain CCMP 1326" /LENGTH=91 /DNA_ID=CAMNT_0017624605 /DNA_START=137 /DNA_END=409 /DNA_ORIENTATION=+
MRRSGTLGGGTSRPWSAGHSEDDPSSPRAREQHESGQSVDEGGCEVPAPATSHGGQASPSLRGLGTRPTLGRRAVRDVTLFRVRISGCEKK